MLKPLNCYSSKNSLSESLDSLSLQSSRVMDDSCYLPVYFRRSGTRQSIRKSAVSLLRSSSPSAHKLVHAIPLIVLMSFFILWWFSHPVNLVVKDGRIVEIHLTRTMSFNGTYIELAILATATSPINSSPLNLTRNNVTEAHPVALSETD